MAINITNPVVVGAPTKKDHYDRVFDNTVSLYRNVIAGVPIKPFGGHVTLFRKDTSYPVGATADKLAPNTRIWALDSANLPDGVYKLEAMLAVDNAAATVTLALVNLTDASETEMVTITSTSTTGALVRSSAITFAAAGVTKNYGVKIKTSNATHGAYAWGIEVIRES